MSLATYTPTTFWYQFRDVQDPFVEWLHDCVSLADPPLVTSISNGVDEYEVDRSTFTDFNTLAQKYALQGGTIVVASGNNGVNSQFSRCGYYPLFPASSMYVTAVGATMGPESDTTEIACQSDMGGYITSGGGFSNIDNTPTYQSSQIDAYWTLCGNGTNNNCVPATSEFYPYNVTGRGYPDVSIAGYNYQIVVGDLTYLKSSTAASSASFAAMVSLLNADRMGNGYSSLGFLNTVLYRYVPSSCIYCTIL